MRTTMRADLTVAVKARDKPAIAALRSALAAIENAEAVPVDESSTNLTGTAQVVGATAFGAAEAERRELTEDEVAAIVANEVSERTNAADEYVRLGRDDQAERLRAEAEVLNHYL
ncbi:GatB/YqeY domain-containing protein [Tenggerimyces flavus]|uniref:GatB/YqeY domain-containing protein n=1 Tax=Tenggerimyces flavus TaxID=1708749 RepID=A0ABV7YDT7_9ACTN|nr:GatB/YqeY domain-containing protein [Tenggerimyces flavus]MBM7786113.1 uncharacterized protein YqeY [Tenggerimyces flavus]